MHLFIHDKNITAKLMWSCLRIKNKIAGGLSKRFLQRAEHDTRAKNSVDPD